MQVNVPRESFPPNVRHLAFILGKSEEICAEALRQSEDNFGGAVRLLLSTRGPALEKSLGAIESSRRVASRSGGRGDLTLFDSSIQTSDSVMSYQDVLDENPSYALTDSSAIQATHRFARPSGSPHKGKPGDPNGEALRSEISMWSECNGCFDDRVRQMNGHEAEQEEESLSQLLTAVHARKALHHAVRLFSNVSALRSLDV